MSKNGAYEQVTRTMVLNIQKDISQIDLKVDELSSKVTDLFNHQSTRLPTWGTALIAILSSLVTGLVVAMVK